MHPLLLSLSHGDKRMVEGVEEAVGAVENDPSLFQILIDGLQSNHELIAMRSADAIEKLTITHTDWLLPFKKTLNSLVITAKQKEVRWHLCQIITRLELKLSERKELIEQFKLYLNDQSKIVITFTMQTLVDLAGNDKQLIHEIFPLIEELTLKGSPAMRSRGKKLLVKLRSH